MVTIAATPKKKDQASKLIPKPVLPTPAGGPPTQVGTVQPVGPGNMPVLLPRRGAGGGQNEEQGGSQPRGRELGDAVRFGGQYGIGPLSGGRFDGFGGFGGGRFGGRFGVPTTSFGPDDNLIGRYIPPGAGGREGRIGEQGDVARDRLLGGLDDLYTAPNRGEIARDTFNLLRESTEPAFQQELRGVGQKAAALGRIGSGVTTSELGDVQAGRERYLSEAQRALSSEAASAEMGDRLARLAATGDVTGLLDALQGSEYSRGAARRGEARGEREYQHGLSREAIADRERQALLEDQLFGSQFGRQIALANLLGGYGFGGGGLFGGEAALADLLGGQAGGTVGQLAELLRLRGQQPQAA